MRVASHRIAERATFKEMGGFRERSEARRGWESICIEAIDPNGYGLVASFHRKIDVGSIINYGKLRQRVFSRKYATAGQMIQSGTRIPTRDKDTFLLLAGRIVPLHRNAVGGIFTGEPEESGKPRRTNMLQSNQPDP